MSSQEMSLQHNLTELRKTIPPTCTLVAVSKTQPPELIMEAHRCGQRIFGENRAQEMASKFAKLPQDIAWHMVGHLQSNKIKYIAPFVSLIHSVDSARLLEEISRQGKRFDRVIPVLLQVYIAEEESKFGFSADEIFDLIGSDIWTGMTNVQVRGLMGMATFTEDENQVRGEFKKLRALFDELKRRDLPGGIEMSELSMGMSGDYRIAIEEGSTIVRVGTAIFGERTKPMKP